MVSQFNQGSNAGRLFPAVDNEQADEKTGTRIVQLTDFRAHSNHLYFTNSGWVDEQQLLFNSDRGGSHNLYSVDLDSGRITQLTDLSEPNFEHRQLGVTAAVNPKVSEVYFWYGNHMLSLNLTNLKLTTLFEAPEGFNSLTSHASVTADGQYVCTSITEDVEETTTAGIWNEEPVTRIMRIPVAGNDPADVVHEETTWLSHSNASPTQPHLMTFAQEGPWDQTTQRIWGLDLNTGETWKIRPEIPGEEIGHEYWLTNGEDIGYHGRHEDGTAFYGVTTYDNTAKIEEELPADMLEYGKKGTQVHFHSNTRDLVVADGSPDYPYLILWQLDEQGMGYETPRLLARHDLSTFKFGRLHVHPRFSPDGSQVLFLSDRTEYANLYIADIPDVEELPLADI